MKEKHECEMHSCEHGSGIPLSRRDFIRTTAIGAAGAAIAGSQLGCSTSSELPRAGLGNLFMESDKPLLVVVEGDSLSTMLEAGIDAIGGLNQLVSGKNVVLKPNVLNSQAPPITTPIETVIAAGKHAQSGGAASITICDSNSGASARAVKFEGLGYPEQLKGTGGVQGRSSGKIKWVTEPGGLPGDLEVADRVAMQSWLTAKRK